MREKAPMLGGCQNSLCNLGDWFTDLYLLPLN